MLLLRCKVIETKSLMGHVVNGLSDLVPKVQVSAIRCLHSLSRSVRQLRTSFQDQEVWKPIRPVRSTLFTLSLILVILHVLWGLVFKTDFWDCTTECVLCETTAQFRGQHT